MSLFSGIGKANRDEGNDIDRFNFANGYALYAFDLTSDLSEGDHFNLARQGTVRVDMKFANALPHTITVVAYAEFENIIEIDRNRNVTWINIADIDGHITRDSFRVLLVVFVAIIVVSIASLEVEV
jgi:hypothetical protein